MTTLDHLLTQQTGGELQSNPENLTPGGQLGECIEPATEALNNSSTETVVSCALPARLEAAYQHVEEHQEVIGSVLVVIGGLIVWACHKGRQATRIGAHGDHY